MAALFYWVLSDDDMKRDFRVVARYVNRTAIFSPKSNFKEDAARLSSVFTFAAGSHSNLHKPGIITPQDATLTLINPNPMSSLKSSFTFAPSWPGSKLI